MTGTAVDEAGNSATTQVTGVNVDLTPPSISFNGNQGTYTVDQTINISCTASDALSGIAQESCPNLNAPAYEYLGPNTLSASATDRAGNASSATASFRVIVTGGSLDSLISSFVTDPEIASELITRIGTIACAPDSNARAGQIGAFDHDVNGQIGKTITAAQAAALAQLVTQIDSSSCS